MQLDIPAPPTLLTDPALALYARSVPDDEDRNPFDPPPLKANRVHWPARIGREELMIETLPEMRRQLAEHLVQELLRLSGLDAEVPDEASLAAHVRLGFSPGRIATVDLVYEGAVYHVTLDRVDHSVIPDAHTEELLGAP